MLHLAATIHEHRRVLSGPEEFGRQQDRLTRIDLLVILELWRGNTGARTLRVRLVIVVAAAGAGQRQGDAATDRHAANAHIPRKAGGAFSQQSAEP